MKIALVLLTLVTGLLILGGRSGWFGRSRPSADDLVAAGLIETWKAAAAGAGLSRSIPTVSGPTEVMPGVLTASLGPPTVLLVRLLPGMVPNDVRAVAGRLAHAMGAVSIRVEPRGFGHVLVTLLTADPLAGRIGITPGSGVLLGVDEHGAEIRLPVRDLGHVAAQGATRAGKSTWLYALLSQVARDHEVIVAGVDPSGLLLRPFSRTRHAAWQAVGLSDLARVELVMTRLVAEMDQRIGTLPVDRDAVTGLPTIVVVLEEYPGLLRALDAADPKIGKRVRLLVARLLSESAKAGFVVVLVAQRAEASVLGGTERSQCSVRLTFRQDTADAVKLLHPDAPADAIESAVTAPAGVALLSIPGQPIRRIRAPYVPYRDYAESVS